VSPLNRTLADKSYLERTKELCVRDVGTRVFLD